MSKYLSCADTAKLIRQSLKEAFPKIKFAVRSSTYSGGASINVSWIDGPNEPQVKAVAGTFSGAYFDGMTDFKGSTYAMIDGQQVRFGADFVFCNRRHSRALCEKIALRSHYAGVEVKGSDELGYWLDSRDESAVFWLRQSLHKHSDRLKVEKSRTAGKVIYLGNDGYSDVKALNV
jgi:hypothetical protein